jgi:hypothetical protein
MSSSFPSTFAPEESNFVNYREFEDFRQESRDAFGDLSKSIDEKFSQLGVQVESLKNEIQAMQIDQLKFQLSQTEKNMDRELVESKEDRKHTRNLTIAITAAIIGPLVGAFIGATLPNIL